MLSFLGLESSISWNIRHFLWFFFFFFFSFFELRSYLLRFFLDFRSWNIRNAFFEEIEEIFSERDFLFFELELKSTLDSCFCKTFHRRCLTVFWIWLGFWIYQSTEYAFSSKYARDLNIRFPKYEKNLFKENIRKFRFLKIRKAFFEKIGETFSEQGF